MVALFIKIGIFLIIVYIILLVLYAIILIFNSILELIIKTCDIIERKEIENV